MKRFPTLWAVIGLSLLVSACGSDSSSTKKPTADIKLQAPTSTEFSLENGNVTVSLDGSGSSSPRDGATLKYRWQLVSNPSFSEADLSAPAAAATDLVADLPGNYVISLIVNDGTIDSQPSRIELTATSPIPVAITETTYSLRLGVATLGLDGSKSLLPHGKTGELDYKWTLTSKPETSAGYISNEDKSNATLHPDVEGKYLLNLVVSFDGKASEPRQVSVTVSAGDAPPVAKADDVTVKLGEVVTLDASNSEDPDGKALQYRWKWGYNSRSLPIPELKNRTSKTAQFTPIAAGTYNLKLFVFDGKWKSEEKDVVVTVEKDPAATTNAMPVGKLVATGYYPSNSVGDQEVGYRADFKFEGYDPEGEPLQVISATLLEKPAGSTVELINNKFSKLGHKIQKLDTAGTYKVEMTVSDGVNQVTSQATMEAKVGMVNNRPSTSRVDTETPSVVVGQPLLFIASSKDKDNDPLTFEWTLKDKPDGSNATIVAEVDPDEGDMRRARVVTDVPGSYTAELIVKDDRGLYAKYSADEEGFAKLENQKPEIRSVVWARNWGRLKPGENYYQILPCMSLLHRAVVVDPDGDKIDFVDHIKVELIEKPEGGAFTTRPSAADCPNTVGQVFTKPGRYKFRYIATDTIEKSVPYDFVVDVDSLDNAKGVRLRSHYSDGDSLWRPLPHENKPPFANVTNPTTTPIETESSISWSLQAVDGDYTIEQVKVSHINAPDQELVSLKPRFENVAEGIVIKQGTELDFKTVFPAVPCIRTDDRAEGFHFSFRIKEIPEVTFTYEKWLGPVNGSLSQWEECTLGQIN